MQAIFDGAPHEPGAPDRIRQMETELARLSGILDQLTSANASRTAFQASFPDMRLPVAPTASFVRNRAQMVRNLIRQRRKRDQHFAPHLFADPAWDMLLDLYAAHYEGKRVSVSSLCIAAAVPATTALRWIRTMESEGHFIRSHDFADRRRIFIRIGDEARARMDDYFDELSS